MMIPAAKAVFLLSLFTFLGTHARNLPEDILKISNTDYGLTSSSIRRPPRKSPLPPQVKPPTHPMMSVSDHTTENKPEKIIEMPSFIKNKHKSPPPAPYVAPPQDQANAYHGWTSIFATSGKALEPSHLSQHDSHARGKLRSFSYVRGISEDDEIIKRPALPSPPPPHLAPPHGQMEGEIIKRPALPSPPPPHLAPPHGQMEVQATE